MPGYNTVETQIYLSKKCMNFWYLYSYVATYVCVWCSYVLYIFAHSSALCCKLNHEFSAYYKAIEEHPGEEDKWVSVYTHCTLSIVSQFCVLQLPVVLSYWRWYVRECLAIESVSTAVWPTQALLHRQMAYKFA